MPAEVSLDRPAFWIATCAGIGYAPVAPGTLASLPVALLLWLLAPSDRAVLGLAVVAAGLGIWAAGRVEAASGVKDPGIIVVDEVAGMLVAALGQPRSWGWLLALFVLFRGFDIWKPFPIRRLQAWPGGLGVVADDLLAGLYANLLLQFVRLLLGVL